MWWSFIHISLIPLFLTPNVTLFIDRKMLFTRQCLIQTEVLIRLKYLWSHLCIFEMDLAFFQLELINILVWWSKHSTHKWSVHASYVTNVVGTMRGNTFKVMKAHRPFSVVSSTVAAFLMIDGRGAVFDLCSSLASPPPVNGGDCWTKHFSSVSYQFSL